VHELHYEGSFRLVRKIAEGGMATVYEAEQLGPAGFSEIEGDYFITMEFIQGPTLRALIDRHIELSTPIPRTLAAYIASRVCRALDFAHHVMDASGRRLDIVHRDVSPGNVMITWDGHIKLADFGIAKAATSIDPAEDGQWLMGKKHYASPEQILGLDVKPSSDVFSLGVVLFELLALKQLFQEERTALMIEEVAVKPLPEPRTLIPGLDSELEQILLMALERDPERRAPPAAMGQALDGWIAAQRQVASPDQLQAHLAKVFPASYTPRTATSERTSFTAPLGSASGRRRRSKLLRFLRG
jgi:serine/threonine protein kinase